MNINFNVCTLASKGVKCQSVKLTKLTRTY